MRLRIISQYYCCTPLRVLIHRRVICVSCRSVAKKKSGGAAVRNIQVMRIHYKSLWNVREIDGCLPEYCTSTRMPVTVGFVGFTLKHHPQRVGDTMATAHTLRVSRLINYLLTLLSPPTCTSGDLLRKGLICHSLFMFRPPQRSNRQVPICCEERFEPARLTCVGGRRQNHLKFPLPSSPALFPDISNPVAMSVDAPSSV